MKRWLWILPLALLLSGCGMSPREKEPESIRILTTIYPVYETVKQVAGNTADVTMLIPPGAEAHDWEPSASAIREMRSGALLFYNGGGLEPIEELVKEERSGSGRKVALTSVLDLLPGEDEEHGDEEHEHEDHDAEEAEHGHHGHHHHHHEQDPHVWLDPRNVCKEVDLIVQVLSEEDKANADTYRKNGEAYKEKLLALDRDYETALAQVNSREMITTHAAFAYLAARYHLHQVSAMGISPDAEPTPRRMAEIIEYIKEHQIPVLFMDASSNPRIGEVIAEETGIRVERLNPLESITMEDRWAGKDYLSIMRENLEALQRGLGKAE